MIYFLCNLALQNSRQFCYSCCITLTSSQHRCEELAKPDYSNANTVVSQSIKKALCTEYFCFITEFSCLFILNKLFMIKLTKIIIELKASQNQNISFYTTYNRESIG